VAGKDASNVGKDVKVFIVLIFASFSLAESFLRFDEFNALNPFYHFIPELIFNAQSQRSAITMWFMFLTNPVIATSPTCSIRKHR